ncbi:uncharacterized protein NECHADRAFT_55989 [Fusarium vanettenii 77-13-4]|uniref:DUF1446-domain-containing protein n=1 Tax=Fusarium vanettenii (strain ATCC MYA-4622 / CBS 123669 / FGSC 9596 / NRRL 45880 / 77-13-4) TaxID=660122 RepID=C7ZQ95_FUSV7|nr:uncharacterized protein NECHADRAFT_55989 [Fusarium vanettenii 77-13-4]EEU33826.1 hypothetical protein NECHADRAFT_55989 [Fusarium vanettenii 77-13-4]
MPAPVRIANCSGATGDGPDALRRVVKEGSVDFVTADYLAEANIAWQALERRQDATKGFDKEFLKAFDKEVAQTVVEKGIKIIHNGGGLNPKGLAQAIEEQLLSYGIDSLKVAYVEGDDVIGMIDTLKQSSELVHLDDASITLAAAQEDMLCANAYLGMGGIVAALDLGADIVICGRCCDASPVMGAAAWWHGWKSSNLKELAGSLIAGHCIECGCYATGGNFSGFKSIPENQNQGFPIAEIEADGKFHIFLQDQAKGLVSRDTITAQVVYEIQGPFYLNPDVIADITNIEIRDTGKNRVTVTGIRGLLPPPTTKLATCSIGGYQCETSVYAVGLDIKEKLAALKGAFDYNIPDKSDYQTFRIDQYGVPQENPASQALATCQFRIFAQSSRQEPLRRVQEVLMGYWLGGFPGMHLNMDFRTMEPKPYVAYLPFLIKYDQLSVRAVLGDRVAEIGSPPNTAPFTGQKMADATPPDVSGNYGPTKEVCLGTRVHARSGDKGSNANVGLWVQEDDEYEWLRSFLSLLTFKTLLGDEYDSRLTLERFELPNIRCVHFRIKGILDGGISSTPRLDGLAKSVGEFLRARYVNMPLRFVERGAI